MDLPTPVDFEDSTCKNVPKFGCEKYACMPDWSQKSFFSVELTRAKPSSTIVAYEVTIGKTPHLKQCNPDILAIDYSCLSQTDMKG